MSDAPRRRPWYRLQFNLGTLLWLVLVTGMGIAWWQDRQRFDARLAKLEKLYTPASQTLWGITEVLGAPDDPQGYAGKSWCPITPQGADWLEVGYDRAVSAATIDLYETYSLGCVTEVLVVDGYGDEVSIWKGTDPTGMAAAGAGAGRVSTGLVVQDAEIGIMDGTSSTSGFMISSGAAGYGYPATRAAVFKVKVPAKVKSIQRVKVHVDSTNKSAYACFDAIGLTTKSGKTTWATSATCSTVYGSGSKSASLPKEKWWALW